MSTWKKSSIYELWLYKYNKPFKKLERGFNKRRLVRSKERKEFINKKYHKENEYKIIEVFK